VKSIANRLKEQRRRLRGQHDCWFSSMAGMAYSFSCEVTRDQLRERAAPQCATFASVPTWCDPSFYRFLSWAPVRLLRGCAWGTTILPGELAESLPSGITEQDTTNLATADYDARLAISERIEGTFAIPPQRETKAMSHRL